MARNLKTSWVSIATSGPVVHGEEDGRFIKKEWLQDMADTYNTKIFTAKIWPEHRRYYSAGTVLALKVEPAIEPELKGELQLFAILSPSDWLMTANAGGDFTFPSIEVGENFRGTGKYFLKGLGVTDEPASAGVTELKFSTNTGEEKALVFSGNQFDLPASLEKPNSLLHRIFGSISTDDNPEQDDDTMTPEQMTELTLMLSASISESFKTLKDDLSAQFSKPNADASGEGEGDTVVPVADFSALKEENSALKTRLDVIEEEFSKLKATPGDHTDAGEGEGDGEQSQVI